MRVDCISLFIVVLVQFLLGCDTAFPTKAPTRRPTVYPTPLNDLVTYNPTLTSGSNDTYNPTPTLGVNTYNPTPTNGANGTHSPTAAYRPTQYPTPMYFRQDFSEVIFNFYIKHFPLIYLTKTTEDLITSELVEIISNIEPPCAIKNLLFDKISTETQAVGAVGNNITPIINERKLSGVGASPTRRPTVRPTISPPPTFRPTPIPTLIPTQSPSSEPTPQPTVVSETLSIKIYIATKSPRSTTSSIVSYMTSSFNTSAFITALNSVCNCSSAFSAISVDYDVSISSLVIIVNDVSFATLIQYTTEVDPDFVYWFMYFVLPSIAIIYISWLIITVMANDNSEFQAYFYCFFSGLSTVNMLYDIGNTFSSCFVNYRYLWASIAVTWLLPSLCFLVSTILNNQLVPYYILDSYIGWWCLFKRYECIHATDLTPFHSLTVTLLPTGTI